MALGLNIIVGFAGLLDLGYDAFFAKSCCAAYRRPRTRSASRRCIRRAPLVGGSPGRGGPFRIACAGFLCDAPPHFATFVS
jgi:ABC-type branched-subunit amino acid transport system permease subunit